MGLGSRGRNADQSVTKSIPQNENFNTAMEVFSRYLLAYPVMDTLATITANIFIDIMTEHTYLSLTKEQHLHQS